MSLAQPGADVDESRVPLEARLLASLPLGVIWIHGETIRWANPAFAELLDTTIDEALGTSVYSYVELPQREVVRQRNEARRRGERQPTDYEVNVVSRSGRRLRLVIEPRELSREETLVLLRDVTTEVRGAELLVKLGEVAARLQRARTTAAVIEEAQQGLPAVGLHLAVFRTDGSVARLLSLSERSRIEPWLSTVTGPLDELQFPIAALDRSRSALEGGRAYFVDDAVPRLQAFIHRRGGGDLPPGFDQEMRALGLTKMVIAPITVRDQSWGFLMFAGGRLLSSDAAALSLFASQFSAALEMAQSIEDLELRNRQLEAIHEVASIGAEVPVPELVPKLLQTMIGVTRADSASLFELDREEPAFVLQGAVGYDGPLLQQFQRFALPVSCKEGGTLTPRASSSAEWPADIGGLVTAEGFHELAQVPLVANGELIGMVNLTRRREERFTDEELRTAQILMTQVGLQFERARLYSDARRRVEDLSLINELGALIAQHLDLDKVLDTAMRYVSRIVDVTNTFLLLVDETGRQLKVVASNVDSALARNLRIPLEVPAAATESVRSRKPVLIVDAVAVGSEVGTIAERFGHRALLAVPLLSEDNAIGALVLADTQGPRRFTSSEVERAVAVANQLGTALDHARLFSEQRQRVEQLRLLLDMSRIITGSLELQQILQASAESVARMIDATDAFVWLLEDTELQGVVASDPAFSESFSKVRLSLSDPSAVAVAITSREPVRVMDALTSTQVNQTLNTAFHQRSLLAIPLMLRDVPIGAISIGDRRRHRVFTDDEVERALLISRQVAVAIDNARLFENLKSSYHELARAQQELVKRERLAALGELSAVVAHEVRNPLGVIFNSLVSLKRSIPPAGDARVLLDIVGEEADRLNRMVSDLLDFARPHEADLRPEPLHEVVQGALEAANRASPVPGVTFRFEAPADLPLVPLDAQMIRQALVNLVTNAAQAMPRGGTVIVRAAPDRRGSANVIRLEVQDNGPGIPPEIAEQVFQPFFTTKAAGTGLGLAVVKRIADAHHAELTLRSQPGEGSTFTLWMPA